VTLWVHKVCRFKSSRVRAALIEKQSKMIEKQNKNGLLVAAITQTNSLRYVRTGSDAAF
jgi:hypothetical protein